MKKGKIFAAIAAIVVIAAMLAGCMAGISETKINTDGSGSVTMKVGYTLEALKSASGDDTSTPDLSGYDVFEYGDTTYYGAITQKTFANVEEFNTMTWYEDTMAEINMEAEDNTKDRPILSMNEDGSMDLSITISGSDSDEDFDITDEDAAALDEDVDVSVDEEALASELEDAMAQMAFVMTFEMPAPVRQTAGTGEGVTIEGNVLTIDLLMMSGDEDAYYAFTTAEETTAPVKAPAVILSNQKITVNGEAVELEVYNIDGYNYFKLRDMAMLLSDTPSQFEVAYNAETGRIDVTTGASYTPAGGELETGSDKSQSCVKSSQSVAVNNESASLEAYNLGGNNFFKLRDLGDAIGFGVDYNEETHEVIITSAAAE
ncbi:MAG: hypothetical protein IJG50_05095 [Clostridia bacterium]|nr:hypothetical protein [Clostridia bacterium]